MKPCSVCRVVRPAEDFQIRRASVDGRTAACKECLRKRDAARWPAEAAYRIERHKDYIRTPNGRVANQRAHKNWQMRNALKRAAHIAVGNVLRDGKLVRKPCIDCGSPKSQAHHEDYSKPLDVVWLCARDHRRRHA